jgi:hypothetical protein
MTVDLFHRWEREKKNIRNKEERMAPYIQKVESGLIQPE